MEVRATSCIKVGKYCQEAATVLIGGEAERTPTPSTPRKAARDGEMGRGILIFPLLTWLLVTIL